MVSVMKLLAGAGAVLAAPGVVNVAPIKLLTVSHTPEPAIDTMTIN